MDKPGLKRRTIKAVWVVILALSIASLTMAAGCGPQTPEKAVRDFYKSIEKHDWNAYLNSVLPARVRRMTESDIMEQKKEFLDSDYKYTGLKLKADYKGKDKNRADVELQAGLISGKNPSTGKTERTTIAKIKKEYDVTPTIATRKYKGRWYVDIPLATADQSARKQ